VSHTWAIGTEREYPWADGLALARRVVSAFGTKRSMFATDWPVCTRPVWPGGGATYDQVPFSLPYSARNVVVNMALGTLLPILGSNVRMLGVRRLSGWRKKSFSIASLASSSGAPPAPSSSQILEEFSFD
jgi:hypothetical protein